MVIDQRICPLGHFTDSSVHEFGAYIDFMKIRVVAPLVVHRKLDAKIQVLRDAASISISWNTF